MCCLLGGCCVSRLVDRCDLAVLALVVAGWDLADSANGRPPNALDGEKKKKNMFPGPSGLAFLNPSKSHLPTSCLTCGAVCCYLLFV
jgi:hypothetical protein